MGYRQQPLIEGKADGRGARIFV